MRLSSFGKGKIVALLAILVGAGINSVTGVDIVVCLLFGFLVSFTLVFGGVR